MLPQSLHSNSTAVDALYITMLLMQQLWHEGGRTLTISLFLGCFLGLLSWWVMYWVVASVNRDLSSKIRLYVSCTNSAILTILCVTMFVSIQYVEQVAKITVDAWVVALNVDQKWNNETFKEAYEAAYNLKDSNDKQLENFSGYPHPDQGGNLIPTSSQETQKTVAGIYIKRALKHFDHSFPFLSWILWAKSGTAQQDILDDMAKIFMGPENTYNLNNATKIAGERIFAGLVEQTPRLVVLGRSILILLYVILQSILFGLTIRFALKDIREEFPILTIRG